MAYFTSYAITRCRPGQSCQHLIEEINKQTKTRVIISFYFSKSSCLITVSTVIRLALREMVSFVSPRPSMLPEAKPRSTLRIIGNNCFVILFVILDAGWHTNLPRSQGARPDHARVESSSCCFPMESMSFVRPRELRVLSNSK